MGAAYLWAAFVGGAGTPGFPTAEAGSAAYNRWMLMPTAGVILAVIATNLLVLGLARPVTTFLSCETSSAIDTVAYSAAEAASSGVAYLTRVMSQPPGRRDAPVKFDRVKCRFCGYLNPEAGVYCSRRGKPF